MRNIDEVGSNNRLIYEDETFAIIGAAMDVYYRLGCGFLEPVYQEALAYELGLRQIPFTAQTRLTIRYKDHTLRKTYRADFVCFEKIIVEIKSQTALIGVDWSQLLNYMKVSSYRVDFSLISVASILSRKNGSSYNHGMHRKHGK